MDAETVTVERRFCGPPESGNGGYVAGRLGQLLSPGPVAVRLRVPPPLVRPLEVRRSGDEARLFDGDTLVAEARPTELELDPIEAPAFEEAVAASRQYRGFRSHWFPTCFVCGPDREPGDGLCIFPGPLGADRPNGPEVEGERVAAPWVPDASLAAPDGRVRPEFLWSALDCPGGFSFAEPAEGAILLGELQVALSGPVSVGERCVLVAHQISHEGRKHRTVTALFGEDGECRGTSLGIWIEVPDGPKGVGPRSDERRSSPTG